MNICEKCILCNQSLRVSHDSISDCLKALIDKIESLENKLDNKKSEQSFSTFPIFEDKVSDFKSLKVLYEDLFKGD